MKATGTLRKTGHIILHGDIQCNNFEKDKNNPILDEAVVRRPNVYVPLQLSWTKKKSPTVLTAGIAKDS